MLFTIYFFVFRLINFTFDISSVLLMVFRPIIIRSAVEISHLEMVIVMIFNFDSIRIAKVL